MKLVVCTMKRSPPMASCGAKGGGKIYESIKSKCKDLSLEVEVTEIKCLGYCEDGPNVSAAATGKMWSKVNEDSINEIINFCSNKR